MYPEQQQSATTLGILSSEQRLLGTTQEGSFFEHSGGEIFCGGSFGPSMDRMITLVVTNSQIW